MKLGASLSVAAEIQPWQIIKAPRAKGEPPEIILSRDATLTLYWSAGIGRYVSIPE